MLLGSLLSSVATAIGALPILFVKKVNHQQRDVLLGFTAGMMLSASLYSLIPQALSESNFFVLLAGLLLGVAVLSFLDSKLPHIDITHTRKKDTPLHHKTFLIITALTLHNIPEGLSVGVSYASEQEQLGGLIALAIGFQNMPEGFLIALFLIQEKISKWKALAIASFTGFIEFFAAVAGYALSHFVQDFLPLGLAFAAGSMLYIIFAELIPESHGDGHHKKSTYSFIVGIVAMLFLIEMSGG